MWSDYHYGVYYIFGIDKAIIVEPVKEKLSVDQLLDQYNDYMTLHKMFGDKEYLLNAKITLNQLKQMNNK